MTGLPGLADHVAHFRRRVLQDALYDATAICWERRAAAFEDAMPKPGDFTGRATPDELEEQRQRLTATAQACRHRASISLLVKGEQ